MPKTSTINELYAAIEEFAEEYAGNLSYRPRLPREPKIIHDPLWGTIRLHPWEVALLDLPLLQRLRQIRQTSLTNYVFPGCNHSRFEHTLGVMHQAQRLAEAVNGQYVSDEERPFDHNRIRSLRLAALFHDCGHGCFSHVSESIFQFCPDMQAATADTGPYPAGHAHEVMSSLILKSTPVRTYLDELSEHYGVEFSVTDAAGWIVGTPEDGNEDRRYVAQVINGPFDADKLDYVFRDAHYSGLPIALDLDRLWASCSIGRWKSLQKNTSVLTLHRGSTTPLEQILFNKITLFSIVYQHPKVRAAECMFQGVVEYCRDNELTIHQRALRMATDFLWVTDDHFFGEALALPQDNELHRMVHDILYRRHFLRAFTISRETTKIEGNEKEYEKLLLLCQKDAYAERRELALKIWQRAGCPGTKHQVWVDLPPIPPKGEADRIIVRMPGNTLEVLGKQFTLDFWADQYVTHKWRGHVFCPPELQSLVYAASKSVLEEEFGLEFNQMAKALSHVPD